MNESTEKRNSDELAEDFLEGIVKDKSVRRAVTQKSHLLFFHVYFPHYVVHETALFQKEMLALSEEDNRKLAVIMAFRGSGKSTIMNMSYALWSVLGVQQKKFVLIVSKTQNQAKNHFLNIRRELETNKPLSQDLGPFEADETNWGMHSLTIKQAGAKIIAVCRDQSIRGIRHGSYRPDLIILDDIEDSTSMSEEERSQTYQLFLNEVLPAGDGKTKIVVLGNLLHEDSLLMRLRKDITDGKLEGVFRGYPIQDDNDKVLWPGRFPTKESFDELKKTIPDRQVWEQEYLLQIRGDGEVRPYDSSKEKTGDYKRPWDEKKFPPRDFMGYVISAPVIYPEKIYWIPKTLPREDWDKGCLP